MPILEEEEEITLSSYALAALQEFQREEEQLKLKFNSLANDAEKEFDMQAFEEDWNLSQVINYNKFITFMKILIVLV